MFTKFWKLTYCVLFSDYDRQLLREKILGYRSPSANSSEALHGLPFAAANYITTPLDSLTSFPVADIHYGYPVDAYNWNNESAQPMFEDNFLAFETASSNASYANSSFDTDSMVQSPTSPTFSSAVSVGNFSDTKSLLLSPNMSVQDPATPATMEYNDEENDEENESSDHAESDELLDSLLRDLQPTADGKYRCEDVDAEDHECDYVADRKCMLRKHLESTLKTNICRHPDCKNMQFSSKAVLTRHEKEAHRMHAAHQFFCPVSSCERHNRGFPREYNMGDHIQRVHRELDVNNYLKKNKRARKHSTSSVSLSTASSGRSSVSATGGSGVRKSSGSRVRREKLERQYRHSREQIGQLIFKLPEQSTASAQKCVEQMKTELARLEDAISVLHASAND